MGFETNIVAPSEIEPKKPTLDDGHMLRSQMLDAFARLEKTIADKACEAGVKPSRCTSMSDYLQHLAKAEFKNMSKAKQRIEAAQKIVFCRNDVVHSELGLIECSGTMSGSFYIFQNVGMEPEAGSCLRLIEAEEFAALPGRIRKIANEIKQQPLKATAPASPVSASD